MILKTVTSKERGFILSSISEIQDHSNGNCLTCTEVLSAEVKKPTVKEMKHEGKLCFITAYTQSNRSSPIDSSLLLQDAVLSKTHK